MSPALRTTTIRTRLSRVALMLSALAILGCAGATSSHARGSSRTSKASRSQTSSRRKCAVQSRVKKRRAGAASCPAHPRKPTRKPSTGAGSGSGSTPTPLPGTPPLGSPIVPVLGGEPPVLPPPTPGKGENGEGTQKGETSEGTQKGGSEESGLGGSTEEPAPSKESAGPFRFFSPTSIWNAPLPAGAELDPSSVADMAAFNLEVSQEIAKHSLNINTTAWSIPIYTVPANQPTVKVKLNKPGTGNPLQMAWEEVPLPSNAQPAKGTDKSLLVWQPSTDRLWEFWTFEWTSTGPVAGWGGAMQNTSSNPGAYNTLAWPRPIANKSAWEADVDTWGGSASSLSIAGGLMTLEDLERGKINHALAIAIPNVRAGVWAAPAQRTDGRSPSPLALPEGAHLRLDPNLDLSTLHLPPLTLRMAEAAQRYGIVVRDGASNIAFYGQDPTPTGANPYLGPKGYYENQVPYNLLASFPWSHLELLKMELK